MANTILLVGDWHSDVHEEPLKRALERAGLEVLSFKWCVYFQKYSSKSILASFLSKFQDKYMFGFLLHRINKDLLSIVKKKQPNFILFYRGSHVYASTVRILKKKYPGIYIIGYNNDDPFSMHYPFWKWRHYIGSLPYYDLSLAYRIANMPQMLRRGARQVDLLRSWYLPWIHRRVDLTDIQKIRFGCEVVFIGHYESDGRCETIDYLAGAGVKVKIFGTTGSARRSGWNEAILQSNHLQEIEVSYLKGEDYVIAINSAQIALCFLSKLNNDTYTRRCFEIPACGTALFSEWSEDLDTMFQNGVNAVLFKTKEELLEKVLYYLEHPDELELLAKRGQEHVCANGHDVFSRTSWLVKKYGLVSDLVRIDSAFISSN